MKPAERKAVNRRVVFFAGKAAPACMLLAFPLCISTSDAKNPDYIAKLVCSPNTFQSSLLLSI